MSNAEPSAAGLAEAYKQSLQTAMQAADWGGVKELAEAMHKCWRERRQVFFCGNGGSAGNAMHLANDFVFGIARDRGVGLRALALPSNSAVVTCLANDIGYDQIYSAQLAVQASAGDILIVFSGSGNSPNILRALEQAKKMGVRSFAVLGYQGGKAKALADVPLHFAIDDMQISEDLQLIAGHMIMQWLQKNPPLFEGEP